MGVTNRMFSTGFWTSELVEQELCTIEERLLWAYIRTCLSSTECGFFQLSIPTAAGQTLIPFQRASEIVAKLDALGVLIFDRGFVFIPNFLEEQGAKNWHGTPDHVHKQQRHYINSGGRPENRAFTAFRNRFSETLAAPPKARKSKKEKPEDPRGTAQGGAPSGSPPPAALHKIPPPTFDQVRDAFRRWRLEGTERMCPNHEIVASEFMEYYNKRGWPEEWRDKITIWGARRLKDQDQREEDYSDGAKLPSGRRIGI